MPIKEFDSVPIPAHQVRMAEHQRQAYLLRRIHLLFVCVNPVYIIASALTGSFPPAWYVLMIALNIYYGVGYWAARKGFVVIPSVIILVLMFALNAFFISEHALRTPDIAALALTTIVAGFLLGRRGAITASVLSIAMMIGALSAQNAGYITPIDNPTHDLMSTIVLFILICVILVWFTAGFRKTLEGLTTTTTNLDDTERRLAKLVNEIPDGIVSVSAEGIVESINPAIEHMTGYTADELVGRPYWSLPAVSNTSESLQKFRDVLAGDLKGFTVTTIVAKDGTTLSVEAHTHLLKRTDGTLGVTAVVRDVTEAERVKEERDHLQEQLQTAQRMEALGRLAGGVAHDFNNWLTLILANAELLEFDVGTREEITEIRDAAMRSTSLTRQLLTFARSQPIVSEHVAVSDHMNDLSTMLERMAGKTVALQTDLNAEGLVLIDPAQFEQIVMNLVINARDAIGSGGSIAITTRDIELTDDQLPRGHYVQIDVVDNGSGIPEDVLSHIFEPFYSTKNDGTGLGLATVHGIVHSAGGSIRVARTGPEGTHFEVVLPHSNPDPTEVSEVAALRVLIVDDDSGVRRAAERILKNGYDVEAVDSAHLAIERLDEGQHYDLLLSDIVMPDMTGIELLEYVRERHPKIIVVLMSGYAEENAMAKSTNADGFIPKPFTPTVLRDTLTAALH